MTTQPDPPKLTPATEIDALVKKLNAGHATLADRATTKDLVVNGETVNRIITAADKPNTALNWDGTVNDNWKITNLQATLHIHGPIGGSLRINGSTGGNLQIHGSIDRHLDINGRVNGELVINGPINGHLSINGSTGGLFVERSGSIGGYLSINGSTGGDLDINGRVNGELVIHDSGSIGGNLNINDSGSIGRDLSLRDSGSIDGNLNIHDSGSIGGNLNIHDSGSIGGNLHIHGPIGGNLDIHGPIGRDLGIDGSIGGNLDIHGPIGGNLGIRGSIGGSLGIDGRVNGELGIDGSIDGNLNIHGPGSIGGNLGIRGSIGGSLGIDGRVNGELGIRDSGSIGGNLHIHDSGSIGRDLDIHGPIGGNLDIDGSIGGFLGIGGSVEGRSTLTPGTSLRLVSVVGARFGSEVYVGDRVSIETCDFRQCPDLDKLLLVGGGLFPNPSRFFGSRLAKPGNATDAEMASVYRRLRTNLETRSNRPGAAIFYRGEMRSRFWDATKNGRPLEALVVGAYWAMSGFGLSAWRPLVFFLGLAVLATQGFLADSALGGITPIEWIDGFQFSIRSMVSFISPPNPPNGGKLDRAEIWLQLTLRFFGPLLFAQFALAIRDRVAR